MIIFAERWGVGTGRAIMHISLSRIDTVLSPPRLAETLANKVIFVVTGGEDISSHPPASAAVLGTIALPKQGVGLTDRQTDIDGKRELSLRYPGELSTGVEYGSCEQHAQLSIIVWDVAEDPADAAAEAELRRSWEVFI